MKLIATLALACLPAIATAQQVNDCEWQASARNIVEPWEQNTRTFSNGTVRLARMDTIEPAAMPIHLLILSPPYAELGDRQCKVISWDQSLGFYDLMFDELRAGYDPAVGLIFDVPVQIWISDGNILVRELHVTLNQATGAIGVSLP